MIARIAARTPARIAATRLTAVRFYSEDQFGRKEAAHESTYTSDELIVPSVLI
ncbi:hypothetical protein FRC12_019958 [Ceratobasidium sp. 428]|nr:hypothetical protein FRC12_019958 [Ceratobasidium sp. 428]